jgi:hypothetical protein
MTYCGKRLECSTKRIQGVSKPYPSPKASETAKPWLPGPAAGFKKFATAIHLTHGLTAKIKNGGRS